METLNKCKPIIGGYAFPAVFSECLYFGTDIHHILAQHVLQQTVHLADIAIAEDEVVFLQLFQSNDKGGDPVVIGGI